MSTCSACLRGTTPPPRGDPRGSSSKNLSKKSSKRLPPPRGDLPPKVERPTPASAAWISQRCSTLWPSPGITRPTVTTAGLIPQTSHILVAIFLCLLLRVSVRRGGGRAPCPRNGPIGRFVTYSRVGAPLYPAHPSLYTLPFSRSPKRASSSRGVFTQVRGSIILRTSPKRRSEKFAHKKSPRGNLSVGEDNLADRTIRLRHERGRESTEGLAGKTAGGTTGAPRNDTYYGTQRVHAKQGCWVGRRLAYSSDAHSGYSSLDCGCGAWRVLLALAGQDLHRLVRDRPLPGGCAQPCRKLAPAASQAHEAPPRHRAHLPGSIGGAAAGGGDLRARAGRPDKRLHQVRHHRGQRPRGADAIHQGARQG